MYLILKHHCRLISLAREKPLYENEFFDAADTMINIKKTLQERVEDLKALFRDQMLDIDARMKSCCGGLFATIHSGDWSYQELDFSEIIQDKAFLDDPDLSCDDDLLGLLKWKLAPALTPEPRPQDLSRELIETDAAVPSSSAEPPLTSVRVVALLGAQQASLNSKSRTLWWAIGALVIDSISKGRLSWNLIVLRKKLWSRFLEIEPWFEETWMAAEVDSQERAILERVLGRNDLPLKQAIAKYIFYKQMVHWFTSCKECDEDILGTRYACVSCYVECDAMVDLCSSCRQCDVSGEFGEHKSIHSLMSIRTQLYGRPQAGDSLRQTVVEKVLAAQEKADEALRAGSQACHLCKAAIREPLWFCSCCEDNIFVCSSCEQRENDHKPWLYERAEDVPLRKDAAKHHWSHTLVQRKPKEDETTEDHLEANTTDSSSDQDRFKALEGKIEALEAKIASLERMIMERLPSLEST
ncbi:hypothetical protein HGRIS_010375 [Hohenbuehelia grisea]|uniref:ZZ-type domain-containing protein n=1 Tax=Hohenbuehelia grisea TaxID=104357 RepID=A0ABR3J467_9AGAR